MLGYLDADNLLGGARKLDRAASEAAVDRVAASLELSTRIEAAAGIFRLINLKMADGIRLMTLRRGVDPRRFALLSFGGAAGLHAVEVARELDIPRVIVPTVASVLSAWGMLATDLRYEVSRTHIGAARRACRRRRGAKPLRRSGAAGHRPAARLVRRADDDRTLGGDALRRADLRDRRRRSTASTGTRPRWSTRIEDRFHRRHEELYTYASRDQEVVFVNARVAAVGAVVAARPGRAADVPSAAVCAPRGTRQAWFGGWRDVAGLATSTTSGPATP